MTAYHLACYGMGIAFVTDTLIRNVPSDPRNRLFLPEGKRQPAEYLFLLQAQPLHDPGHGDFLNQYGTGR